jgi:hypothetical protein
MIDRIYVGDKGTKLVFDSNVDLTDFVCKLEILKPNGVVIVRDIDEVEVDKAIYYLKDGDVDVPGIYRMQLVISNDDGLWRSSVASVEVYNKFD